MIKITPVAKPRMTRQDKWKVRPCVAKYRAYCDELRVEFNKRGWEIEETVSVIFYIPMPKSWSKKKKEHMCQQPHQQRPDLDNFIKGYIDALTQEDSYIWQIDAIKLWDYEGGICVN